MNKIIYLYISLSCRTNVSSFTKTRSCLRLWLAFSWYLKIKMEHLVNMIEKLENVGLNHNYITNKNSAIWFVISSSLLYWTIYVLCHTWLILYGTYYLLQFSSSVTDSHQKIKPNRTREQMNNEKTKKLQEQNLMSNVPWFKTVGFSTGWRALFLKLVEFIFDAIKQESGLYCSKPNSHVMASERESLHVVVNEKSPHSD